MARLNEPPLTPEDLETLRRKFMRQNREIARSNSNISMRMRQLENELALALSENLALRSQILRLKGDIHKDRTKRIADHALEIKEKMEAQLLEWGNMLAALGHEPPATNTSPRAAKKTKLSPSMERSPRGRWGRRNTRELEEAAKKEGRLPPLWEARSCPRETMNRDEILALLSSGEGAADSPDLGPPPTSRFVVDDVPKLDFSRQLVDSPTNALPPETETRPQFTEEQDEASQHELEPENDAQNEEYSIQEIAEANEQAPTPPPELPQPSPEPKASLKRKASEEEDIPPSSVVVLAKPNRRQVDKAPGRPAKRNDDHVQTAPAPANDVQPRKPLGARDVNEPFTAATSKKQSKSRRESNDITRADLTTTDKGKGKKRDDHSTQNHDTISKKVDAVPSDTLTSGQEIMHPIAPSPSPLPPIESHLSAFASPSPASPHSMVPLLEKLQDTPPPPDLAATSSRGSRRNRAAVSYAEPNLRDKMRRPSKQLLDAVTGEGKVVRRTSNTGRTSQSHETGASQPNSAVKLEETESPILPLPPSPLAKKTERLEEASASPLNTLQVHDQHHDDDALPTTNVSLERKKRRSTLLPATNSNSEPVATSHPATAVSGHSRNRHLAPGKAIADQDQVNDVYEFPSTSSPNSSDVKYATDHDPPAANTGTHSKKLNSNSRSARSRRLSSIVREDLGLSGSSGDAPSQQQPGNNGRVSRKRASMMAQRLESDAAGDGDSGVSVASLSSSGEAEKGAVGRRRTVWG